ncbi:hypothetical protein H2199_002188 [Coniosporium tulheliwenetii]|uniref:Uncharacterized protein n=1 Tax=Coniosporium tulheliwenetii TaxID=3383036 RepID=A0ACC2ZI48_9PEZI|nr:hypothetical protein H2199_002188 [Cladosporium sp. JES 115]
MRIRKPFAAGFCVLLLLAASAGLAPAQYKVPEYKQSDKLCFYWILETNRRRNLQLTLLVCTAVLGVGSEILQGLLPNGRIFDPYDIVANIAGSLLALTLCNWYHKRMLERKRQARYGLVVGEEGDDRDVELGEGIGPQETGVARAAPTVEEELDNWDENAEDWDDGEPGGTESGDGDGPKTPSSSADDGMMDRKKRSD